MKLLGILFYTMFKKLFMRLLQIYCQNLDLNVILLHIRTISQHLSTHPNQGFPARTNCQVVYSGQHSCELCKLIRIIPYQIKFGRVKDSRKLTDEGLIEEQLRFRTSAGIYCYLSLTTMNLLELIIITSLLLLLFGQVHKVHIF